MMKRNRAVKSRQVIIMCLLLHVSGNVFAEDVPTRFGIKEIGLAADFNRDGVIESTENNPFVFWINNDDDAPESETSGVDIAVEAEEADHNNLVIDGTRDLIDFFAVAIDLHDYLNTTDIKKKKFYLQHEDEAVNVVFTTMSRGLVLNAGKASDYLKKIDINNVTSLFGSWQTNGQLDQVPVYTVFDNGKEIPKEFIELIKDNKNKGIILIEGNSETSKPLEIIVKGENNNVEAQGSLPLHIYEVEELFRQVSLRDDARDEDSTKWGVNRVATPLPVVATLLSGLGTQGNAIKLKMPEIDSTKHVIFVHGFNVTLDQAREAQSEVFKRLYHSGSNAIFTGIHWNGDEGLINPVNYWYDVENAFYTADDLAALVNGINGSKTIIAHSLGNMLVGLAIQDFNLTFDNYFMLNPAVALEVYIGVEENPKEMRHPDWDKYYFGDNYVEGMEAANYGGVRSDGKNGRLLWTTEWYQLFSDERKTLTWRNRLSTVGNSAKVVQYYSSGEEVLKPATNGAPNPFDAFPELPLISDSVIGTNAWNIQEKSKGTANAFALLAGNSSSGWGFNLNCSIPPPLDVTVLCNDLLHTQAETYFFNAPTNQLITQPFFESFDEVGLMELNFNKNAFENSYPHVLSFEIPALSFAAGGTKSAAFPSLRATDMNNDLFDSWPAERGGLLEKQWRHSDYKDVSYRYVYPLYDDLVTRGGLK